MVAGALTVIIWLMKAGTAASWAARAFTRSSGLCDGLDCNLRGQFGHRVVEVLRAVKAA
jgi:hypothetical protein